MKSDYFEMHGYYGHCLPMIEDATNCCLSINYFYQLYWNFIHFFEEHDEVDALLRMHFICANLNFSYPFFNIIKFMIYFINNLLILILLFNVYNLKQSLFDIKVLLYVVS